MSTWQPLGQRPEDREPKRLSEYLDRAAKRLGGPSSGTTATVFARWEEVVGPDIATHARPVSLRDGALVLAVDHPAWATQLRYMTADLLTRISEATAGEEVTAIHIRVTGQPDPDRVARNGRKRRG